MKLVFRSNKKGLNRLFGELEAEIMNLLWEKGPLKGRELHAELLKKKKAAYTTVLTVLDRLSKKGFIKKDRTSGKFTFAPAISRERFQSFVTGKLIKSAFELSPHLAVSAFADIFSRMSPEELDKLAELIEEKRNEIHK